MRPWSYCRSVAIQLRRRMYFNNKVVLITGASSGIGAACALQFAKSLALLSIVGRNADNLKTTADRCEEISKIKPLAILADITSEEDIKKIVKETVKRYGKIDVLINNAGVSSLAGIHANISTYDRVMATNVRGTYLLTGQVIPYLIKTKGNIVNISSILSSKPMPIMIPYCMSKAAIDMFTKCVAIELGGKGVRVNALNPGPVKTEMFKRSGMSDADSDGMFASIESNTTLKRIVKGDDVADLVMFLASDKANCITGSCYVIDCGLSLGDAGNY